MILSALVGRTTPNTSELAENFGGEAVEVLS